MIYRNSSITQREIGERLTLAVSQVNKNLNEYEKSGYIKRKYYSTKSVEYFITKEGKDRIKTLNISYLESSKDLYETAKNYITDF